MRTRTVLDGNAFYEIDEECLERKGAQTEKEKEAKKEKKEETAEEKRKEQNGKQSEMRRYGPVAWSRKRGRE